MAEATNFDDWKRLLEGRFWLELRPAGQVPQRKGSWPKARMKEILREFMAANPDALISVVTIDWNGPMFEDAPEVLAMIDRRTWPTGKKHLITSYAAYAAVHQKDRLPRTALSSQKKGGDRA